MSHRTLLILALYGALLITLLTPLYDPLTTGTDQTWAILLVPAAAQVGLGASIGTKSMFVAPVAACLLLALAAGDPVESVLILVIGLPAALALTALGRAMGAALKDKWGIVATAAFAVALAPVAWAAGETIKRSTAPHEPEAVQKQLPRGGTDLSGLCHPHAWTPAERAHAEHKLDVLVRELNLHPDWLVPYTYYLEDPSGTEVKDLTVQEVAQETLRGLDRRCVRLRERIERALG
jgi:hypothetical protein